MKYSEAKNETKGEKIMTTKETKNFEIVGVLRERERCAWRCLIYSRWESYPVKFSKQLVPRLGAEAVMLGLSVVKGALEPLLETAEIIEFR